MLVVRQGTDSHAGCGEQLCANRPGHVGDYPHLSPEGLIDYFLEFLECRTRDD